MCQFCYWQVSDGNQSQRCRLFHNRGSSERMCTKMDALPSSGSGAAIAMRRPGVKAEHAPYRISGNKIRMGGVSYGIAAEIEDPAGWVWVLLKSLDGTRSPAEVVDRVVRLHRGVSAEAVRAGLAQLVESGYVEDAAAPA